MLTMKWFMGEKEDLSEVHALRREVFVEEQNVPTEIEFDGKDASCAHLLIYDGDIPVCTGRIFIGEEEFTLGRIATAMSHRGRGIATGLMQSLINACVAMGGTRQVVHSQTAARGFYESLGFVAFGEEVMRAGIPHIAMEHFGGAKKCGSDGHCGSCGGGEHHAT